jgi:para-nitrobenzyl esterase
MRACSDGSRRISARRRQIHAKCSGHVACDPGVVVRGSLALIALSLVVACSSSPQGDPAGPVVVPSPEGGVSKPAGVVTTTDGDVRGTTDGDTRIWKGIPFAAPPVGALRWRAPAPVVRWEGERDATAFGAACMQLDYPSGKPIGSEDCLHLNVWSPRHDGPGLPVLFWIHGGDNVIGAASESYYDAKELAERAHAVVVTIDYRMGAFGFLAHPAFAKENEHHSAGNYGVLDVIAALHWVQRNIAAFGGDAARVLVLGQSAGASNTCAVVASPLAKGLFSRAMMMSLSCGTLSADLVASTNASAQYRLGCEDAADQALCLRGKSAADVAKLPGASLLPAEDPADYYETVDGWVLPERPELTIAKGAHNHVAMVLGTTRDEYPSIIDLIVPEDVPDETAYRAKLETWFAKPLADQVFGLYPLSVHGTPRAALAAIASDQLMHCPTRRTARAAAVGQTEPVYRYLFAHAPTGGAAAAYGAAHGVDVDYLFRTFTQLVPRANDFAFSDTYIEAVAGFAATGTTTWPHYDGASDPYVVLDNVPSEGHGLHTSACDFWDTVPE